MFHGVLTKEKPKLHLRFAVLEIAVGVPAADGSREEGKGDYMVPNVPGCTLKCPEALGHRVETVIGCFFLFKVSYCWLNVMCWA